MIIPKPTFTSERIQTIAKRVVDDSKREAGRGGWTIMGPEVRKAVAARNVILHFDMCNPNVTALDVAMVVKASDDLCECS